MKEYILLPIAITGTNGKTTTTANLGSALALAGKKVALVANLKPAVLCGVESHGMILAADAGENDVKVIFVDGIPAGSKVR